MTALQIAVRKAKKYLQAGDPVEAVEAISMALRLMPMNSADRHALVKAHEEAESGSPEKAEHLLAMVTFGKPTRFDIAQPVPKPKPPGRGTRKKLPPDPDDMNDERADWADTAIEAFIAETRTDREDAVGDLLTDLMHWCDRNPTDFNKMLARASDHYREETATPTPIENEKQNTQTPSQKS